jgi:hypothetical protein
MEDRGEEADGVNMGEGDTVVSRPYQHTSTGIDPIGLVVRTEHRLGSK